MDLVPDCVFVLITATLVFAWVGEEFAAANGLAGESGTFPPTSVLIVAYPNTTTYLVGDAEVNEFLKKVTFGMDQNGYEGCVAKLSAALDGGTVQINISGDESDEYWDAFEAGY